MVSALYILIYAFLHKLRASAPKTGVNMADMTVWYIALLVGAAMVILGARSIYNFRRQMRLGELSTDESVKGVDAQ